MIASPKDMKTTACPDEAMLRAFALGDLGAEDFDRIADHLGGCPRCESALQPYDDDGDGLVEHVRSVGSDSTIDHPFVPAELVDDARSVFGMTSSGSRRLVVDAGRAITQALEQGPYRLGKFELLAPVGAGSFGSVFRARDTELDRVVAVKIQRASAIEGPEENARFLREARSAAQLEHPGIVSLYETGETDDGACFLVTEFVEGDTLEQRIRERPPDPRAGAALVAHLARAVEFAHAHGVIHRDIKPSNIVVDADGKPHLMDFGLAKRDRGEATVTADGQVMGTPAYMSPEQAAGDSHHVNARTDIFSLGVVLYELMTGDRPFQGNRRMLMLQILEDDPRPPRRLNERVPRDLETICLKAMAKSPAYRYATAATLADDLDRFGRGEPILARPASVFRRLRHWCRRNPLAASLLAAVTLGSTTGMLNLAFLSHEFVEDTALASAQMQARMLEEVNAFYSEIVGNLGGRDVDVTHEYLNRPGAVPLPATFTIEAGRRISASGSGMQVRLYSEYPFPWRTDGGLHDEFERDAWRTLRANPGRSHYQFTEIDGRPVLRYATARIMKPSCLGCHNSRADSPKRDWQVGDVRGVLEITRPLHKDVANVRAGLRGSFILVAVVSALLLGLAVLALVVSNAQRRQRMVPV